MENSLIFLFLLLFSKTSKVFFEPAITLIVRPPSSFINFFTNSSSPSLEHRNHQVCLSASRVFIPLQYLLISSVLNLLAKFSCEAAKFLWSLWQNVSRFDLFLYNSCVNIVYLNFYGLLNFYTRALQIFIIFVFFVQLFNVVTPLIKLVSFSFCANVVLTRIKFFLKRSVVLFL